ncbi:MAG: DNA methyltransferase, partial [Arcobacter skirrowii]|nr:DNA methyltransferase [Aliarcobacter skirrowii]
KFNVEDIKNIKNDLLNLEENIIRKKYNLKDSRDWELNKAILDLKNNDNIQKIEYRPFDTRYTYLSKVSKSFLAYPRFELMKNMTNVNYGLIFERGHKENDFNRIFIVNKIIEVHLMGTMNSNAYISPLYLYPDENSLINERTPNLNLEIVKEIEEKLALKFVNEKIEDSTTFAPIDILDYIYAVLHSPSYREKYKEFLKIDFPRVPYPKPETFWQLVSLGGKLRSLHLLEDTSLDERIIDIKGEGKLLIKNSLNKKDFTIENAQVELRLNDEVSVVNIPLVAWEFYIGGYQPAQKWLKDRVGRVLNRADMKHYNRIINALCKTDLIMKKIDEVAKF